MTVNEPAGPIGQDFPDLQSPLDQRVAAATSAASDAEQGRRRPGVAARVGTAVAGLLAAGTLVLGLVLCLLAVGLPLVRPGTGLLQTAGPGWNHALAQLGVGMVGEVLLWGGRRRSAAVEAGLGVTVIAGTVAALAWVWWF